MDPMTLSLLVGGGGLLINHLFRPGQTRMKEADFDYDPERRAAGAYDRLSSPGYGAAQFDRMAGQASIGAAALQRLALSRGGSVAQGTALAEASRARAADQAFGGYSQFRTEADRTAQGYLGMDLDRQRFVREGMAQQRFQNAQTSASFDNQILGGLSYLYGSHNGGR